MPLVVQFPRREELLQQLEDGGVIFCSPLLSTACPFVYVPTFALPLPVLVFQLGSLAELVGNSQHQSRGITKESFEALPLVHYAAERYGEHTS